jgi:quercetin dioxygenase-like cupin family protein
MEIKMFNKTRAMATGLVLGCGTLLTAYASPRDPLVHPLLSKHLADIPGKEVMVLEVEYPPSGVDPVHRHDAHGFIYVLEGRIVMAVKGGKTVTLRAGDTFYEGPHDIHAIGRNASRTKRARFLAVLVKNIGADAVLPAK